MVFEFECESTQVSLTRSSKIAVAGFGPPLDPPTSHACYLACIQIAGRSLSILVFSIILSANKDNYDILLLPILFAIVV